MRPFTGMAGALALTCIVGIAAPVRAQNGFTHQQLLAEVNAYRSKEKLPPLKDNPQLDKAAQAYADDMARHNWSYPQMQQAGHRDSAGKGPVDRAKEAGYTKNVTENALLGSGSTTAKSALEAWLKSPGHKLNLSHDWTVDSGFGMAKGSTGNYYFVHKLGGEAKAKTDLKNGDWVEIIRQGDPKRHIARIEGMGHTGTTDNVKFNMVYYEAKDGKPTGKSEMILLKDATVTIKKL